MRMVMTMIMVVAMVMIMLMIVVMLAVVGVMPWTGAILFALAASISVACVAGRYHYTVDIVAGAALALAIWAIVLMLGV